MKGRSKLLIALLVVAVLLFGVIRFYIIPQRDKRYAEYMLRQQDAATHDITQIEDCKTPYMGDASNIGRLFDQLPLSNTEREYEIDSESCVLTVHYLDTVGSMEKSKVQRNLVYNTVAAMASIDNLEGIVYTFSGDSFSFTREEMKDAFGEDLSALLPEGAWEKLESIAYTFSGDSFSFTREEMKDAFGEDLSALLPEGVWEKEVQEKLNDPAFLEQFYS